MQFNLSCLYCYTVTLTADAHLIPVGYVVPEWRNITFTCTSSLGSVLLWNLDLKVPGETVSFILSVGLADQVSQVTSPDTSPRANPATITIHNVTSKNNGSTVVCSSSAHSENDSATILVEGGDVSTAHAFMHKAEMRNKVLCQ